MKIKKRDLALRIFFSVLLVLIILILTASVYLRDKIYPGIFIAGVNVSGLTKPQAEKKVERTLLNRTKNYRLSYASTVYELPINKASVNLQINSSVDKAFKFGRNTFYFKPVFIEPDVEFNESLISQIKQIGSEINIEPIDSQIKSTEGEINVTPSQNGKILDEEVLLTQIKNSLLLNQPLPETLPVKIAYPSLSYDSALKIKTSLDKIKLKPIALVYEGEMWFIDLSMAIQLIDLNKSKPSLISGNFLGTEINIASVKIGKSEYSDSKFVLNQEKLDKFLENIALEIDRPVEEPLFQFDPSSTGQNRVSEFKAPINGKKLIVAEASDLISKAIIEGNTKEIELPVETIEPKNKLSNDLGIKELIGRGVSNFAGSIPNRAYNVGLAASRINGSLVKPGETFSFVKTVGDISGSSGYKQAYVIKSGKTVLDDGGGVCQVSTTLFRSVLNSGLPVIERTAHAYRVGYYEQGFPPGLDATIFSPSVDFKFKNDTDAHILIQAYTVGTTLYIDFYGTNDGRIVYLTTPVITSQTPAPPELRQDDPTLPKGTVKQVDFAANGANVIFSRTVTKNGQTFIQESFRSNYRPWQAVYLVGTQ